MTVVFDTCVIVSAIFWHASTARQCLIPLAHRKIKCAITDEIANEYTLSCAAMRVNKPQQNPAGPLAWMLSRATHVEPQPLGKQRSRDPKDDPFLACALAARAEYIISNDRYLLALQKPFGISIVTPAEFLRTVSEKCPD